jgi:DNA-binding CsgD family transcriptional regulator
VDADQHLRPLERRIRHLVRDGVPNADIAQRFRRSPEFIDRVITLSERSNRIAPIASASPLRPLERRILHWRDRGAEHAEIGPRFHRTPGFIERVELLARYKLTR